jgi:hypothetical protein
MGQKFRVGIKTFLLRTVIERRNIIIPKLAIFIKARKMSDVLNEHQSSLSSRNLKRSGISIIGVFFKHGALLR